MRSFLEFATLSCMAVGAIATYGGREIPEVDNDVARMTKQFAPAVTYAGPTEAVDPHTKNTPTSIPNPASYWLADIKHQGVAAFNPNAEYQVFRNVKDFGAKGKVIIENENKFFY